MKSYRYWGAVVVACILAFSLAACGGSSSSSSSASSEKQESKTTEEKTKEEAPAEEEKKAEEEAPAEEEAAAEEQAIAVTIDGATTGTDYEDNPVAIVTYTFTNVSSDEAVSFMSECTDDVYQNGVECEMAIAQDLEGDSMAKVKAGASTTFQKAYKISDTSPIEVEVGKAFSWDKVVLATGTFELE